MFKGTKKWVFDPLNPSAAKINERTICKASGVVKLFPGDLTVAPVMVVFATSFMSRKLLNTLSLLKLTGILLSVGLAIGCGQDGIKAYTVSKESAPPTEMSAVPEHAAPTSGTQLKWKTPDGWQEIPPGTMRVASFKVTGADGKQADVSVIPLPGSAGGDFSNVNRWRGQVGLAPVTEEEFAKLTQPVEIAGQPGALYEAVGDSGCILAAIQHREGTVWFFKMTGDGSLVTQVKPVFVEFLKSVQFVTGETMPVAVPEVVSNGKPNWSVPTGWQEVSGGQFLVAKFVITGTGGAQAGVNVSSSASDGGGLAANVNRWRKQLGLSELTGEELAKSVQSLGPVTLVEMVGQDARTSQPAALVGAMVSQAGQMWFYKLMGEAKVVAAQKTAFIQFVQGVKY